MSNIAPKLGKGVYTIVEAARYARVSPSLLARWVFGSGGGSVIKSEFDPEERIVSYLDFVQTMAIREFRTQRPWIRLKQFRQACDLARSRLGMPYPFAMKNATFWDGSEIVIVPPGKDAREFVQASGRGRGQMLFPFVETYLDKLEYDPATGVSNGCNIFRHDSTTIRMRPSISFGEPLLPSGYSAACIWDAIMVEGGIDQAAKAYSIPPHEVRAAYHFHNDYLVGIAV
jgi:hypothetical protein